MDSAICGGGISSVSSNRVEHAHAHTNAPHVLMHAHDFTASSDPVPEGGDLCAEHQCTVGVVRGRCGKGGEGRGGERRRDGGGIRVAVAAVAVAARMGPSRLGLGLGLRLQLLLRQDRPALHGGDSVVRASEHV